MSMGIRVLLTCACCRVYSSSPKYLTFLPLLVSLISTSRIYCYSTNVEDKVKGENEDEDEDKGAFDLCLLPC